MTTSKFDALRVLFAYGVGLHKRSCGYHSHSFFFCFFAGVGNVVEADRPSGPWPSYKSQIDRRVIADVVPSLFSPQLIPNHG